MKIYVISLKDAVERRKNITNTMQELALDFEFIEAVDGRAGLPKKYESMVNRTQAKKRLGMDISDAEISCALSHALVYKKIVEEEIAHAIILEDDAIIGTDFSAMIEGEYLEKSNVSGMFLYHLYGRGMKWGQKTVFKEYKVLSLAKTPLGAVGYYIRRDMATVLCENALPISFVSDWGVDVAKYGMKAIFPRIVQHPNIDQSSLEDTRTRQKKMFGKYGFFAWVKYKILKPFSVKISKTIEGK